MPRENVLRGELAPLLGAPSSRRRHQPTSIRYLGKNRPKRSRVGLGKFVSFLTALRCSDALDACRDTVARPLVAAGVRCLRPGPTRPRTRYAATPVLSVSVSVSARPFERVGASNSCRFLAKTSCDAVTVRLVLCRSCTTCLLSSRNGRISAAHGRFSLPVQRACGLVRTVSLFLAPSTSRDLHHAALSNG